MKIPSDALPDTILLRGQEIKVLSCSLPHAELRFYPENPRIYSAVRLEEDAQPTQDDIFRVLSKAEHVRETLVPSIRTNGGLIEPILVRGNIVLEGNSRLAAYRLLSQQDPQKWKLIRSRVLPNDVTDSQVFSLLGEYHMVGKKDWAPYEQAGYLYRRHKHHEISHEDLSAEVGLTRAKIVHLIRVYDYMVEVQDRSPDRWSYYDELLKGRRFKDAAEAFPRFFDVVTEKIKAGEIERAVDLRDQLPKIVKAGGNTLRKFVNGTLTFQDAAEDARLRGAGNYHNRKLSDFRKWLADTSVEEEVDAMTTDDIKIIKYELEKIKTRIGQLITRATKPRKP
jgi:hypothetical protein